MLRVSSTKEPGADLSPTTDPTDLIHLVAAGEATTDQKRLFKYNVLRNPTFRSEIYYQRKTYRLNEAFSDERRLLTAYEQCYVDARGLPRAQGSQAGGVSPRRSTPNRSAAPVGSAASQRAVSAPRANAAPIKNAASQRIASAPRASAAPIDSAASQRAVPVPRVSRAPIKSAASQGTVPPPRLITPRKDNELPRASTPARTSTEQSQRERRPPSQPTPIPTPVARRLFAPEDEDFDGFQSHTHISPVKEALGYQTQEPASIIDLVISNVATMDQLDLFEKSVIYDKRFKAEIVDKLRLLRQQSAVEEVDRLVKLMNRVAIHNLFQL